MCFLALATDYNGTLAQDGVVDSEAFAALQRLKESGRHLILVTGRELPDLQRAFPELGCCDLIVAENGALLHEPGTGREHVLASAPPEAFVARLRERGVRPLSVDRSIVASWEPMQDIVLETIVRARPRAADRFQYGQSWFYRPESTRRAGAALERHYTGRALETSGYA